MALCDFMTEKVGCVVIPGYGACSNGFDTLKSHFRYIIIAVWRKKWAEKSSPFFLLDGFCLGRRCSGFSAYSTRFDRHKEPGRIHAAIFTTPSRKGFQRKTADCLARCAWRRARGSPLAGCG